MAMPVKNPHPVRGRIRALATADKEGRSFAVSTHEVERACAAVLADPKGREKIVDDLRTAAKLRRRAMAEIAKGNADRAAFFAFEAGVSWHNACMLYLHADQVRYAERDVEEGVAWAEKRNRPLMERSERRMERMRRLLEEEGYKKVRDAARKCAREELGKNANSKDVEKVARAIWSQWYHRGNARKA